jgi:hypothetical protein
MAQAQVAVNSAPVNTDKVKIFNVHDMKHVAEVYDAKQHPEAVRVLDSYAATSIASYACIRMSDANGNPSETYWKCYVVDPAKQCGFLMNSATVEKVMTNLMEKMIAKHEESLLQINDDVTVCKWLMKFKEKWEEQYRDLTTSVYDISEYVLAVMQEAVQKTERIFEAHAPAVSPDAVRAWLKGAYLERATEDTGKSLPIAQAVTRFYFRNTELSEYMCVIAGKIWKLQEVCDKPGAFPSTKQQNLLQKQQQDAVSNLVQALGTRGFRLPDENERELYCMDHKTYQGNT